MTADRGLAKVAKGKAVAPGFIDMLADVDDVWVNGVQALKDGVATGAASGKLVHGRAWTGARGASSRIAVNFGYRDAENSTLRQSTKGSLGMRRGNQRNE
jgi:hypothetical protein